jgi:hypothetical protein
MEQKAIISPATIERLLSIDTSFFGIPSYRSETKNGERKDIWYLKNVIRFVTFCKDLDQMNQTAGLGFVVGRALAEASWCKTVIRVYKRMHVLESIFPDLNVLRVAGHSKFFPSTVLEVAVDLE